MIKSLSIENFQSHAFTELEFDPGVNVIIGRSDSGKTAIIRALNWLLWNRPGGDAFRSSWGGDTVVNLNLDEGQVQRIKSKENMYVLGKQKLKAVGMDVPEEIKALLNMDKINSQNQLDRPFLLDNSPGEVAQFFNQIARFDVIDIARKNVEKWLRQITSDIQHKESAKDELESDLEQYEYLADLEKDLKIVEQKEEVKQELESQSEKLRSLLLSHANIQTDLKKYETILSIEPEVDALITLYDEMRQKRKNQVELKRLISLHSRVQKDMQANQEIIAMEKDVDQILIACETRKNLRNTRNDLEKILESLKYNKKDAKTTAWKLSRMEEEFDLMMPDICPLCEQKIGS